MSSSLLHPCECPECGSAASEAQVRVYTKLVGYDGKTLACILRTKDNSTMLDDTDVTPTVEWLHCDDCGHYWKIQPMRAVVRVLDTEGE